MLRHVLLILSLLILPSAVQAKAENQAAPVILVSFDGFHPSYLSRGVTPNLSRLVREGVSGPMRPSFPSKTFPNHWTLVTGLVPDHSGLVGNRFEDPRRPGVTFTMADDDPFWWNEGEPIWAAAEKAGIRTATMFWPGSNVAWGGALPRPRAMAEGGVRPQDWLQFNQAVSNTQRVNTVLDWLRRPPAIRPRLITLYFDLIDTAGHDFGPDDARMAGVIADADRIVGDLLAGFQALGIKPNLIVVSDHGMAATTSERVIRLDQLADPALYRVVESGPYAALEPTPGNAQRLWAALAPAAMYSGACWVYSYSAPLSTATVHIASSRSRRSTTSDSRTAPRKVFQPAASAGLCSSIRSSVSSSPPRRARIAVTTSAGSAMSAGTKGMRGGVGLIVRSSGWGAHCSDHGVLAAGQRTTDPSGT